MSKEILVVGQTPPPYHGQAVMVEKMLDGNYDDVELSHVRMAFSEDVDEVGKLGSANSPKLLNLNHYIYLH